MSWKGNTLLIHDHEYQTSWDLPGTHTTAGSMWSNTPFLAQTLPLLL